MQMGIVPVLSRHSGGIYQYSQNVLLSLYHANPDDSFFVFAEDTGRLGVFADSRDRWKVHSLDPFSIRSFARKYLRRIAGTEPLQKLWEPTPYPKIDPEEVFDPDVVNYQPELGRRFARAGADFVFYPAPVPISFEAGVPFVTAVHDLRFELYAEFPDMLRPDGLEAYDYCLRNTMRYAALILADSDTARKEILEYGSGYGLTEERIAVLPPIAAYYLDPEIPEDDANTILGTYGLAEPYIFYPSAFWPHKNHRRLIEALESATREYSIKPLLVLCGSRAGQVRYKVYREVMDAVSDAGLQGQVTYIGDVPDEHMSALYSRARLVVAPMLHGGSISILQDAWLFGCPAIVSTAGYLAAQAGDAALHVDPRSVESIASAIRKLWMDSDVRSSMISKARDRSVTYSRVDYDARLRELLHRADAKIAMDSY